MSLRSFATRARVTALVVAALCAAPATTFAQELAPKDSDRGKFLAVYASFITLQAMDVHSTLRALDKGATEANPLMGGVAGNAAGLIAMKAGSAAATLFLAQQVRKHSHVGALIMMAGINSAYATIVAHNYRAVR